MKLGLKLWSNNTDSYLIEADKLYKKGIYDYIELYVVPNTLDSLPKWKSLDVPYTLHAPHFAHGVNLSKKEYEESNLTIFSEVQQFYDELSAEYIVVHSGIDGEIEETAKQFKNIIARDSQKINYLIENKPYKAIPNKMLGDFCVGTTIENIEYILNEVGCGFCLDVGHAVCTANTLKLNPYEYLEEFNKFNPQCYHLSDNFIDNEYDKHLHFGEGNYDFKKIFDIIDLSKNIAIETNKNSKENLEDFVKDVEFLNNIKN